MNIVISGPCRKQQKIKAKAQKEDFFLYQESLIFSKNFQGIIFSL